LIVRIKIKKISPKNRKNKDEEKIFIYRDKLPSIYYGYCKKNI